MPRWLCGGGCSVFHYLCSLLWSLFISRTLTYSSILFPLWLTESKRSVSRTMLLYLTAWFCCAVDSHFGYFFSLVEWMRKREKKPYRGESCPFPGWRKRVNGGAEGGRESLCKWIIYTGFLELFAKVMMADLSLSQNKRTTRTHTLSLKGGWRGYWRLWDMLYFDSQARRAGRTVLAN